MAWSDEARRAALEARRLHARNLRAGDVVNVAGMAKTIKRVQMTRKDWNNAQLYFHEGGSTRVRRDTIFDMLHLNMKKKK